MFTPTTLMRLAAKVGGARLFERLHLIGGIGGIQAASMGSSMGGRAFDELISKLDRKTSLQVLREAMFDKDKMQALLNPLNNPQAVQQSASLLQPYVKAAVIRETNQLNGNEQNGNGQQP